MVEKSVVLTYRVSAERNEQLKALALTLEGEKTVSAMIRRGLEMYEQWLAERRRPAEPVTTTTPNANGKPKRYRAVTWDNKVPKKKKKK